MHNYEKWDAVLVASWISDKLISTQKVYATNLGYVADLATAKDNQVLTILNFMDYDTRQRYIDYNRDFYDAFRCGIIRGKVSEVQKYKLSLRYSLLGFKCLFEEEHYGTV